MHCAMNAKFYICKVTHYAQQFRIVATLFIYTPTKEVFSQRQNRFWPQNMNFSDVVVNGTHCNNLASRWVLWFGAFDLPSIKST